MADIFADDGEGDAYPDPVEATPAPAEAGHPITPAVEETPEPEGSVSRLRAGFRKHLSKIVGGAAVIAAVSGVTYGVLQPTPPPPSVLAGDTAAPSQKSSPEKPPAQAIKGTIQVYVTDTGEVKGRIVASEGFEAEDSDIAFTDITDKGWGEFDATLSHVAATTIGGKSVKVNIGRQLRGITAEGVNCPFQGLIP